MNKPELRERDLKLSVAIERLHEVFNHYSPGHAFWHEARAEGITQLLDALVEEENPRVRGKGVLTWGQ